MCHGHCHSNCDAINELLKELRVDVGLDSKLGNLEFVPLEKLYKHFTDIRDNVGCKTFQDYNEYLMAEQKVRL